MALCTLLPYYNNSVSLQLLRLWKGRLYKGMSPVLDWSVYILKIHCVGYKLDYNV